MARIKQEGGYVMLKQPTTQPTTKAEEPTTEEELINSADICFPGFGDLAGIDFL